MSNEITSEQIRAMAEAARKRMELGPDRIQIHRGEGVEVEYIRADLAAEREQSPAVVTDEIESIAQSAYNVALSSAKELCSVCGGTGRKRDNYTQCAACEGSMWEWIKGALSPMRSALEAVAPLLQSPAVDHARVPDAVGEVTRNSAGQIYMQWFDKKTVADFVGRLIYASPTPGESHE